MFVSYFYKERKTDIWDKVPWTDVDMGFTHELHFFRGSAVILYCFVCHGAVLPVLNLLQNNQVRQRVNKIISRTVMMQYALYIVIAITGFLTAPVEAEELIVLRNNYMLSNDTFMVIGQIALVLVLLIVIPVKYSILRISFFNLCFKNPEITTNRYNKII